MKGHVTCNSDFDLDGGKSELLRVAHALKLPNPSKLMNKSPTTDVVLGADKQSGRNVSLKIFHHWDDRMVGMLKGEAARDEYDLERHTSEGDLLDIGGHIGVTALFFHKLHPTSQVYIFEPAPLNFFYLALNAITNGADSSKLRLYNRGLSNDDTSFTIEYSPDDTTSTRRASLGHTWGKKPKQYRLVYAMSMQQLKQCLPLDNVGLVKLDCEGCEFEVVPSNTRFFSTRKRRVVGEFHAWHLKQPGHTGNVSDKVIRDVKALLCNRRRRVEDRISGTHGVKKTSKIDWCTQ